jgi:hypothetical protein
MSKVPGRSGLGQWYDKNRENGLRLSSMARWAGTSDSYMGRLCVGGEKEIAISGEFAARIFFNVRVHLPNIEVSMEDLVWTKEKRESFQEQILATKPKRRKKKRGTKKEVITSGYDQFLAI